MTKELREAKKLHGESKRMLKQAMELLKRAMEMSPQVITVQTTLVPQLPVPYIGPYTPSWPNFRPCNPVTKPWITYNNNGTYKMVGQVNHNQ